MSDAGPLRADLFLVQNGHAATRAEAQAAIAAGFVSADGRILTKPSHMLRDGMDIVYAPPHPYVSRGGVKLAAALKFFALTPRDRVALDIGASTGGFCDVLLSQGASRVYAVDVGHGQLHPRIAHDERVVSLEGVNARDLAAVHVPEAPGFITADVSFIGLRLALPPALAMAAPGAHLVALVKPQFEAGRDFVDRGGIVRDIAARDAALTGIERWIAEHRDWSVLGTMDSPIQGGDGNREYLLAARKS